MLTSVTEYADFTIHLFASEGSEHPYQDRWLIHPVSNDTLRVAVIDGVTPWQTEPCFGGDSGQFAASALMSTLYLPVSLSEAFDRVNRDLHNPVLRPYARQTMAAAVALDISQQRGWLDCSGLVAADCEWWVTENGSPKMHLFVGGDARTEEAIEAARQHAKAIPVMPNRDSKRQREAEDYADNSSFHRHAVGRCENPRFGSGEGRFTSVLLASDGALLAEAPNVVADPESLWAWLSNIESRSPRDDFTALLVTLS